MSLRLSALSITCQFPKLRIFFPSRIRFRKSNVAQISSRVRTIGDKQFESVEQAGVFFTLCGFLARGERLTI